MRNLTKNEKGAAVAEYSLLVGLIAVAAVFGMDFIGREVTSKLSEVGQCIKVSTAEGCGQTRP